MPNLSHIQKVALAECVRRSLGGSKFYCSPIIDACDIIERKCFSSSDCPDAWCTMKALSGTDMALFDEQAKVELVACVARALGLEPEAMPGTPLRLSA